MDKYFGIKPFGATPTEQQLNHMKMGKKAFFHFGVNTFSDKEWGDGTEREQLFNPTNIDIRGWIRDIKGAGFELAIITAKHHDGFCLWPSKYTEHSVKNSPYKNGEGDIIREFTDACHEYDIKVGIYISPWDRNSDLWGKDEYSLYYAKQLEELVTQYGRIDEIWWDGAGSGETRYDWGLWRRIIRENQPHALAFGSIGATPYIDLRWVGNEAGFAGRTHYASIDESSIFSEITSELNVGKLGGERYIPAEVDVSIRPGWFYHESQDELVKSSRELDKIWFRSVGNNAIMLLNFPPDRSGNLVRQDVENATISDKRIKKMRSLNLLESAVITADSEYSTECGISNAISPSDELFYASGSERVEINISLSDDTPEYNTIILGEKVELGERIRAFTLEAIDGDKVIPITSGTSVGFLRALTFDKCSYKKLRLTLEGAVSIVTLRTLSLNIYEEDTSEKAALMKRRNLATQKGAEVTFSPDGKSATVMFGGIFPFDTISFNVRWHGGDYKIFAFDGSKYYEIGSGQAINYTVSLTLDTPISSSYSVRIEYSKQFSQEPDISIM